MGASEPTQPEPLATAATRGFIGRYKVLRQLGAGGMGMVLAAHDPELDRTVAIKVVHAALRDAIGDPAQLAREARTMARIAHPNVVTVYEVGAFDGELFLAMELVDGATLREHWAQRAPSWREVVAMVIEAGRGLAIAHHHGLVHLDFKPDNVLVGRDDRPRVTDFGLAAAASESGVAPELDGAASTTHTTAGTPAYMAPERWAGDGIDPRSDQFAFCVTLWECLHGERPYTGKTVREVREALARAEPNRPTRRVPRWLTAALRRGLSVDPGARWPSLDALLDHLSRRMRGRGPWLAIAATATVAATAIVVAITRTPDESRGCELGLDVGWGPVQRAAVTTGIAAIRGADDPTAARVSSTLDAWADRWRAAAAVSCRDDDETAGTARDCLARARAQSQLLVERLARPSRPVSARALEVVLDLGSPEACLTTGPLGRGSGAEVAASGGAPGANDPRTAAVIADLDRARLAEAIHQRAEGRTASARALGAARGLGQPALLAEALALDAVFSDTSDRATRRAQLEEALALATRSRDRYLQAGITLTLFEQGLGTRASQALAPLIPLVRAAVADSPEIQHRRRWALDEGRSLALLGRRDDAVAACARLEQLEPEPTYRAKSCRCVVDALSMRQQEAEASCTASLAAAEAVFGADTAATYAELRNLSSAELRLGRYDQALALGERARQLALRAFGPDTHETAAARDFVGTVLLDLDRLEPATVELEAAIAIWTRIDHERKVHVAFARSKLAQIRSQLGDVAGAADVADRVVGEVEAAAGPNDPDVVPLLMKQGDANLDAGRREVALAAYTRAAEVAEAVYGSTNWTVGGALSSRAQILLDLGRAREAVAPAERGVSILAAAATNPYNVALAHSVLGRVRLALGERARARSELVLARDQFRPLHGSGDDLAVVERALAAAR